MRKLMRAIGRGAAAGAAGVTALNAVTYLDMAIRARPASSTPEESVRKLSEKTGMPVPGTEEEREHRIAGLGPLLGAGTGVAVGIALGLIRRSGWRPHPIAGTLAAASAAMVAGNAPMVALGVADPRRWRVSDWISDIVPHLAYGVVAAAVLRSGAWLSISMTRKNCGRRR